MFTVEEDRAHACRAPSHISNLVYFKGNTPDIFNIYIYYFIYWPSAYTSAFDGGKKTNKLQSKFSCALFITFSIGKIKDFCCFSIFTHLHMYSALYIQ